MKEYLDSKELAARWGIKVKTLRQWRWQKKGPDYSRITGRASYSMEDIIAFEENGKKKPKN